MSAELFEQRADLEDRKRQLEADLEITKDTIKSVNVSILTWMDANGVYQFKTDRYTIGTNTTLWASAANVEIAAKALEEAGHGELCKLSINGQSLSAVIREMKRGNGLPESLQEAVNMGAIKISESPEIRLTQKKEKV